MADVDVSVVARDRTDLLGEGLFWSARDRAIFWTDIIGQRVNRLLLSNRQVDSWEVAGAPGWIIGQAQGDFVAGIGRTIARISFEPFSCEALAPVPGVPEGQRVNDAVADREGRIWFGTMPMSCDTPTGAFHSLSQGRIRRVDDTPYTIPNGPVIHPDGNVLFHTDSAMGEIFRYPMINGMLGSREPYISFEPDWGAPDGMTMDVDQCLWVACWGGSCVMRFDPDGKAMQRISLPASQITNCTFGGENLDRLFVTSAAEGIEEEHAGALFELDPGCRGLEPCLYQEG